jgi:hypothetical protein
LPGVGRGDGGAEVAASEGGAGSGRRGRGRQRQWLPGVGEAAVVDRRGGGGLNICQLSFPRILFFSVLLKIVM